MGIEAAAERRTRVVRTMATSVWEDERDADKFLSSAHAGLGGLTPLEVAASSEAGATRVENLLQKLEHNLPAYRPPSRSEIVAQIRSESSSGPPSPDRTSRSP